MRKAILALSVLAVFALDASAQVPVPFTVYVGGALSLPSAPKGFKDTFKAGYHGMVGLGYKVGPGFQLVGKAEYHKFSYDFGFAGISGIDGGASKMWLFGGDGRFALGLPASPIKPFGFAGIGIANIKQSDFGGNLPLASSMIPSFPKSQNKMYYNFGGGVELGGGPSFSLFAQIRYVSIATEGSSTAFIPITVGLKFF